MAILGNKNTFFDRKLRDEPEYELPAVIRKDEKELSLKKSMLISTILHPTIVGALWLMVFILALLGINLKLYERPEAKMNDIEFVLVDNLKEQKPLNPKTKFRADKNTRTGGQRDKKKKVSMPSPAPGPKAVQQKSSPAKKTSAPKQKAEKPVVKKSFTEHFIPKPTAEPRPAPPSARPSLKPPSAPKLSQNKHPEFAIPVPKSSSAPSRSYSTGPIGGGGSGKASSGSSSGRYAPVPSLSPSAGGSGSGGSSGSRLSKGGGGYGNAGNPGGGGGAPGIDAIREPDFGPYMRELQRRIKMNWDPPKGNESKRVVLLFKIARDGRLLSVRVFKSSGLPNADKAALSAVELTAPFKPLPADFRGQSIDIQFTFDYNVFGATSY